MTVEEARVHVTESLGPSWLLSRVDSRLVPGPTVGAPTAARVTVELDYHPGFRGETAPEGHRVGVVGPHLTFTGEGDSIEDALAVATGAGVSHSSVQLYGSNVRHVAAEAEA